MDLSNATIAQLMIPVEDFDRELFEPAPKA